MVPTRLNSRDSVPIQGSKIIRIVAEYFKFCVFVQRLRDYAKIFRIMRKVVENIKSLDSATKLCLWSRDMKISSYPPPYEKPNSIAYTYPDRTITFI